MRLFVSLFAYAFGKQHWPDVAAAAARELDRGKASSVPGFRTLYRFRKLVDEIELHTDHSTLIARARDRAAGRFLRSTCDQWIAIDDDVDADDAACKAMLETLPQNILSAAMRMRSGDRTFNIVPLGSVDLRRGLVVGQPFLVDRVGMGMIRIPRSPLEDIARRFVANEWDEPSPDLVRTSSSSHTVAVAPAVDTAPGVFLEFVKDRKWLSDDFAFCERARASGVPMWSVILPGVTHAGIPNLGGGVHRGTG